MQPVAAYVQLFNDQTLHIRWVKLDFEVEKKVDNRD